MGLTLLKCGQTVSVDLSSTSGTKDSSTREGTYFLIGGTDDCPSSMIWINQCKGFTLNPSYQNKDLETLRYCNINQGTKTIHNDFVTIKVRTSQNDSYIRKLEDSTLYKKIEVIILDKDQMRFEWNQSQDGKGPSCLYSK
ncbi:MAG: hypothetical protein ACKOX6_02505 [Bdellovibrio sp.]